MERFRNVISIAGSHYQRGGPEMLAVDNHSSAVITFRNEIAKDGSNITVMVISDEGDQRVKEPLEVFNDCDGVYKTTPSA